MFKSAALSFIAPKISSKIKTQTTPTVKAATITWAGTRAKSKSISALSSNIVPLVSVFLIVAIGGMMALHLFWINTYSSKRAQLKKVQTSIAEQKKKKKKLLVKQSLLNSTVSLSDLDNTGLVPVTEAENLVSNTFAQAK